MNCFEGKNFIFVLALVATVLLKEAHLQTSKGKIVPKVIGVNQGEVNITCLFDTPVSCGWHHNGESVAIQDRYEFIDPKAVSESVIDCSIVIKSFQEADVGTWLCQSLNEDKTTATSSDPVDVSIQTGAPDAQTGTSNNATGDTNSARDGGDNDDDNDATEVSNDTTDASNDTTDASNDATVVSNAATEVSSAATEVSNAATETSNGPTEPSNAPTEVSNAATYTSNNATGPHSAEISNKAAGNHHTTKYANYFVALLITLLGICCNGHWFNSGLY